MRPEARLPVVALVAALALPSMGRASAVLEPAPVSSDSYGESFTFIGDLDDGTFVLVQLSVTNIGPGSRNGICRATVLRPGRSAWTPQARLGGKAWRYDEATATFQMGTCTAHASDSGLRVEAPLENGRVVLEYAAKPAPQSPEGSVVEVGGDRYRHEVLLTATPVKVTLQFPKGDEETLSGGGYADHTRSTIPPAKLARRWVRFRALKGGGQHLVLLAREGQDGEFGPVYVWEAGQQPRFLESFTLNRDGAKERSVWRAEFSGDDGHLALALRSTSLLQRNAPVEQLGMLAGLVRPVVGSPVTYLHRGVLERPGKSPVEGLLEVTLEGE
jgi:hypothetical protein